MTAAHSQGKHKRHSRKEGTVPTMEGGVRDDAGFNLAEPQPGISEGFKLLHLATCESMFRTLAASSIWLFYNTMIW